MQGLLVVYIKSCNLVKIVLRRRCTSTYTPYSIVSSVRNTDGYFARRDTFSSPVRARKNKSSVQNFGRILS